MVKKSRARLGIKGQRDSSSGALRQRIDAMSMAARWTTSRRIAAKRRRERKHPAAANRDDSIQMLADCHATICQPRLYCPSPPYARLYRVHLIQIFATALTCLHWHG